MKACYFECEDLLGFLFQIKILLGTSAGYDQLALLLYNCCDCFVPTGDGREREVSCDVVSGCVPHTFGLPPQDRLWEHSYYSQNKVSAGTFIDSVTIYTLLILVLMTPQAET